MGAMLHKYLGFGMGFGIWDGIWDLGWDGIWDWDLGWDGIWDGMGGEGMGGDFKWAAIDDTSSPMPSQYE
ncbi:hypothetical protein C1646_776589 [Rhizophagus diaphanus]|nr:hypothetical protein C1646_776589 [Rhizophagus diaphanus] [Rhizophagus sp. MUCL 43196]